MSPSIEIHGHCIGCHTELIYVVEGELGAPVVEPIETGCVQHAHGHLCPPCAGAVSELLRRRRSDRDRNHAAVARGHQ